uniref:non-specific serine/threonine protein kinase n=1 Tax=Davidia involucrata TaxID=16924 RepID=A0A5B7A6H5_DAVIN
MNQKSLSTLIASLNLSIVTFFLFPEKSFGVVDPQFEACVPKNCGNGQNISFPFWIDGEQDSSCGYPYSGFRISCQNGHPILHIPNNDYVVQKIFYNNQTLLVYNSNTAVLDFNSPCFPTLIRNVTFEGDWFTYGPNVSDLFLLSNCSLPLPENLSSYKLGCAGNNGAGLGLAMLGNDRNLSYALERCRTNVKAPVEVYGDDESNGIEDYVEMLRNGFVLKWKASNCSTCERSGGRCGFDADEYHFKCFCPDRPHASRCNPRVPRKKKWRVLILAIVISGVAVIFIICLLTFIICCCKKRRNKGSSYLFTRNTSSEPSSTADFEGTSTYFGVPVFSYTELEEATQNFDPSKELGEGGFGTVYHGKLRDGREVAVKRLYEHNYKRLEQFMNEIEILTRLRHRNLVSLYGCTSRRSQALLLVYEYIANGTVADHLHGDRANSGWLTWPIRMNIAIETATALAYLHASDIIHRDVKTTNILLDDNFCVKVADFGLSRLFPTDVTHVSTAPQGTPGYVDPEYYQCYHLTDKSDVYSFGVVLIELISSMPAVDISRHRHEINLANLAINRIQKCAFTELVDQSLGFESDAMVYRMTTSVAELAFRCLQREKDMRPTMEEVLEVLKEIQSDEYPEEKTGEVLDDVGVLKSVLPPPSPESDDVVLLKNAKQPPSPDSVTNKWVSRSTTPNTSG